MPTLYHPKDLTEPGERAVSLSNYIMEDWDFDSFPPDSQQNTV